MDRETDPAITAAVHLPLFEEHIDPALPMVDVECGSGAQTVFLAGRFRPCVGIDRSADGLGHARTAVGEGGEGRAAPDFRQLDAADSGAMRRLHGELGDANVYLRGVLRRSDPRDRPRIARSVALLTGRRGRAFVVEAAGAHLGGGTGPDLPAGEALRALFAGAGLEAVAGGSLPRSAPEFEPDGRRSDLPSEWLVVGAPAAGADADPHATGGL